ncbi:hypothetical protein RBB50_010230 [Rhinocladiella similis]
MRHSRLAAQELRLHAERVIQYRGTARVRLENLHFEWNEPRELNRKNVERLKEIFRTENVHRLEPRNHIPAVVEEAELDAATRASEVLAENLLSNPDDGPPWLKFPPSHRVSCLHGRHRIQAARETLPPTDAWWTVDLYLTDSNPELRTTLVEEYANEEKPSDGEIYRKIRQYEREGNVCFKKRWKARLSDHGRRGLRQLFDHGNGELAAAFDRLLDIPGLWDGMRISTLHKMIGMKCDEEVLHYLEHVGKVWHGLLRGDKVALRKVDQATVKALELRAPRYSRQDALLLQGQLLSGQIFGAFSREQREEIWRELRSIDGLIPSLFTFFEDIKYLNACSDCLKRLVKLSRRDTVFSALQRKFPYNADADDQSVIEISDSSFIVRSGVMTDQLDLGYRQLWLFAMRHYRAMPTEARKKRKDLLAKAGVEKADEQVLSEFAALADRLGFKSDEIQALKQRSSDREIARNALLKEAARQEAAQLEAARQEAQRLEAAQLEVVRQEAERQEAARQEAAQLEAAQLEAARQEAERQEAARQEAAQLEAARQEATRQEAAQLEAARQEAARQEAAQLEVVRQEAERQEAARQEAAQLEAAQLEAAQLEAAQLEAARQEAARLEAERLEAERLEQERLAQEPQAQESQAQEPEAQEPEAQEPEAQEPEDPERAQKRHTQINMHSVISRARKIDPRSVSAAQDDGQTREDNLQVDESTSSSNLQPANQLGGPMGESDSANTVLSPLPSAPQGAQIPDTVRITYFIWERNAWRSSHTLDVDPAEPSEVERVAIKYMRKGIRLFDKELNILTPRNCFEAATIAGSNTVLLVPEAEINIDEKLESSISELVSRPASSTEEGPIKRGRR